MLKKLTMGERLAELRGRAGMSLDAVAKAAGYKGRSSVQRFFEPDYDPKYIPVDLAERLGGALAGKGQPPITIQELFTLAGVSADRVGDSFAVDRAFGSIGSLPRDIPVYGTALGGEAAFDPIEGSGSLVVEQAALDQSEVIGYLRRPPALVGRKDVYGIYISGESMYPRFRDGEAVFVDPKRPPMVGDDVILYLAVPDEHDGDRIAAVLIKRLLRRTASYYELEQFNPPVSFRIAAGQIKSVHRIVPSGELLS